MEIPESVNYIDDDAFNGVQSGFYILGVPGSDCRKVCKGARNKICFKRLYVRRH